MFDFLIGTLTINETRFLLAAPLFGALFVPFTK